MKNHMMKLLALLLAASLLLTLFVGCGKTDNPQGGGQGNSQRPDGGSSAGTSSEEDFVPSVVDKNTLSRYTGSASVVVVPDSFTTIDQYAFKNNDTMTRLIFPDSVTVISAYAIDACPNLEEIVFGKDLKEIGSLAIMSCPKVRTLTFPEGMTYYGDSAVFFMDNLEEIYIPASVSRFGGIIANTQTCPKVTVITPEDSLAAIVAAENELPVKTPEGKEIVFDPIPVLERAYSVKDLGDGTCMIWNIKTKSTVIEIPETINGLTVVQLGNYGDGVSKLHIFQDTPNVERIVLPDTMHTIGNGAFQYCPAKEIELGSGIKRVGEEAFFQAHAEVIRFPEGTESLNCPFSSTKDVREVYIPASVTEIVKDIAWLCEGLTVIVPAGSYAEEFIQSQKHPGYAYRVEN